MGSVPGGVTRGDAPPRGQPCLTQRSAAGSREMAAGGGRGDGTGRGGGGSRPCPAAAAGRFPLMPLPAWAAEGRGGEGRGEGGTFRPGKNTPLSMLSFLLLLLLLLLSRSSSSPPRRCWERARSAVPAARKAAGTGRGGRGGDPRPLPRVGLPRAPAGPRGAKTASSEGPARVKFTHPKTTPKRRRGCLASLRDNPQRAA